MPKKTIVGSAEQKGDNIVVYNKHSQLQYMMYIVPEKRGRLNGYANQTVSVPKAGRGYTDSTLGRLLGIA